MIKTLVMFSGGLDSRLAVRIMKEKLGKENVKAVYFLLPFVQEDQEKNIGFLEKEGIRYFIVDCRRGKELEEYLDVIRKPKYARGRALNPCVDCRIFMLKKAKEIADSEKIEIIATGEVLGERPLSQNSKALKNIDEETGVIGRILRPLSALLLEDIDAVKRGEMDKSGFEAIIGRKRERQIELAKKFNIEFPNPAGGCLLCEKEFCKRLKQCLNQKLDEADIEMMKFSKNFEEGNIVIGRNKEQNLRLKEIFEKHKKGILIIPEQPGASALIKKKELVEKAKEIIKKRSKKEIKEFVVLEP